jgi:hypothetical protein
MKFWNSEVAACFKWAATTAVLQTRMALAALLVIAATLVASGGASEVKAAADARVRCTEPWSRCSPDAVWLRKVLKSVGYHKIGETAAALTTVLTVGHIRTLRYYWVTSGGRPGAPYRLLYRVGDTGVYGDNVRTWWRAQGVRVWVEPRPHRRIVARLVAATRAMPRR